MELPHLKIDDKTRTYILIGVIFLTSIVAVQYTDTAVRHAERVADKAGHIKHDVTWRVKRAVKKAGYVKDNVVWSVKKNFDKANVEARKETKRFLYGTYPPNDNPDLILDRGNGPASSSGGTFIYNGHYIREMPRSWGKGDTETGIFVFRSGNFLQKGYNRIPENSTVRIDAYNNVLFSSELNESYHCKSVNMTVRQDGSLIGYREVRETGKMESFDIQPERSENESSIRVEMGSVKGCDKSQIVGVDKFFLESPEEKLPAGAVNKIIYILSGESRYRFDLIRGSTSVLG